MDDGCRLATRIDGPAGKPVVVLANSLGTSLEMWTPQAAALSARFRVLRYDTRGHGRSDVPPGTYTLERLGKDVVALLDYFELPRAHFCGLSLGGMVGQWLGADAPDRIDHLVLANTASSMGPPSSWDERIAKVTSDGMGSIVESVLARWFTPAWHARAPSEVERVRAMLLATSPVGYAACCVAIRDMTLVEGNGRIMAPTLLIAGTDDPVTPRARVDELAALLPTPPRVVALNAAHLANLEQPEAFNRALLDFLP